MNLCGTRTPSLPCFIMEVRGCGSPMVRVLDHGSHRSARPLVRLVEGKKKWVASDHPQSILPQNCGGNEQNCTVTSMVLKANANEMRKKSIR
ncbi:hypothetical protein TNCV_4466761 [Trichonephila clavipes]|nr:hypothetical protein TNCV_4466761 [Trichonephila clavipes]